MARGVTLNATISARDAASKNIKRVNGALSGLGNTAKQVGADFRKVALFTAGLAAGAAAFAAAGIKDAAKEQASAQALLNVLQRRKLATDSVTAAIEQQIEKARLLAFSGEEVRSSVEISTRFTKKYTEAQKIQNVAMDLARSTGMSLEEATLALGKAYQGSGAKLFSTLGITNKHLTGMKAINAIYAKTKGGAQTYADTVEGSFAVLSDSVLDLRKGIGFALLPAVTKLFKGLAPFVKNFSDYIKTATPAIERFSTQLVDKLLAKLPGLISSVRQKFPSILRQIGEFADSIGGVGRAADGLLGPGGSITLLVTGIGAAFGGLRGAIAANLLKGGVDPIQAYFISTVSSAIIEGVVKGLAAELVTKAVAGFAAKMAAASAAGSAASAATGAATAAAGAGATGLGILGTLGASIAALFGVGVVQNAAQTEAVEAYKRGETPMWQKILTPWLWPELFNNPTAPAFGGKYSDPMTAKYANMPQPITSVTVNIGNKGVDDVVGNAIYRLGVPGAPNKY
jgi:hypothetical protein